MRKIFVLKSQDTFITSLGFNFEKLYPLLDEIKTQLAYAMKVRHGEGNFKGTSLWVPQKVLF